MKKNKGFTLLIAIVVTSMMLIVSFVVANVALKQLVLADAGVESQYAFYNADSGADCAVYWDIKRGNNGVSPFATSTAGSISCGSNTVTTGSQTVSTVPTQTSVVGGGGNSNPTSIFQLDYAKGCAIVRVTKRNDGYTFVDSRGYNNCNTTSIKRYERGITLTYQGDENTIVGTSGNSSTIAHISLSTGSISFSSGTNVVPAGQSFTIQNTGTASLSWDATPNQSWCHVSTASGTLAIGASASVTVTVDAQSSVGSFSCTVSVSSTNSDNSPQTVAVTHTTSGIALRSSSNATVTSGAVTVNKPAGTVSGDVMIATIGVRPAAAVVTTPSGWSPLRRVDGGSSSLLTYWKVAGGSEPASYTWVVDASTGMVGGIMSFTGVDTTSIPVNIDGGQVAMSGTSLVTAPSVTTTVANTMLVTAYSINSTANWTPSSGMTEAYDIRSVAYDGVATNGVSLEANYALQSSAGASGAKVASNDSVDQDGGGAQTIALHPAGSVTTNYALSKAVTALSATNPPFNSGPASNLTDGSMSTQAYNGTADQYYSINLGALRTLSLIKVYISTYGYSNPNLYTTSWSIEGLNSSGSWVTISSGGSTPNSGIIYGYPSVQISQIRVRTQSTVNWMGIWEVFAY